MRRITPLISIGLLVVVYLTLNILFAQNPPTAAAISDLERPIHACEQQVASWRHEELVEIAFVVAVIVFGVIISSLHALNDNWARKTTLALGVSTAILTGINSRIFTADDRTLRRATFEGNGVISQLWVMVDTMKDEHVSTQDKLNVKGDYLKKLLEFQAIGERLNGTANAPANASASNSGNADRGFGILPRVHAASKMGVPAWVQKPPSDNTSLYYVGTANANSLTSAKQNSLDEAYHNAVLELRAQAPNASDAALLTVVKASAVVQDSAFTYDSHASSYTYYTLLRVSREIQGIGVRSLPAAVTAQSAPTKFQSHGWQPSDLTSNSSSGMFALDSSGGVSRLVPDQAGSPRIEKLFRLKGSESGYALTATADAVFVAALNKLGCTVYRYSLASKAVSQRLVAVHERCAGIATDGTAVYVTFPARNEIRVWNSWEDPSPHSWPLSGVDSPGYVAFDPLGHRLIFADASGNAYAVSVSDGQKQLLASNLGMVQSIATSRFHILLASGKKVLFLARSDNRGENPPAGLQSLTGGHIVGVAVDAADRLWFADYDKKLVAGPFPLS